VSTAESNPPQDVTAGRLMDWLLPRRYHWIAKVALVGVYAMWAFAVVTLIGDLS